MAKKISKGNPIETTTAKRKKKIRTAAAVPPPPVPTYDGADTVRVKFAIPRWARDAARIVAAQRSASAGQRIPLEKNIADLVIERLLEIDPRLAPNGN